MISSLGCALGKAACGETCGLSFVRPRIPYMRWPRIMSAWLSGQRSGPAQPDAQLALSQGLTFNIVRAGLNYRF